MDVAELATALRSMTTHRQLSVLKLWPAVEFALPDGVTITARTKKELRRYSRPANPVMIEWLRSFEASDVFYDIGASCGSLTLAAGAMHRDKVTIVAIEPSFASFESLVRNLSQNGMLGFTIPLQAALLDRTGLEPMYYASTEPGTSTHAVGRPIDIEGRQFKPVETQLMPTYTLDDLIATLELPQPTRVKIDIDGFEHELLGGAADTLAGGTIKELVIEIADPDRAGTRGRDIQRLLEGYGYERMATFLHHPDEVAPAPGEVVDFLFRRRR